MPVNSIWRQPSGNVWDRRSLSALPASSAQTFDITKYGAAPNDPTNDVSVAWYNAIAAFSLNNPLSSAGVASPMGGVYFPPGTYYTSRPLCIPQSCQIWGAGRDLVTIVPGTGAAGQVAGMSGPIFVTSPAWKPSELPNLYQPNFDVPLVGGVGQSLSLGVPPGTFGFVSSYWLHNSYPWGTWIGNLFSLTSWALEFWVRIDNTPGVSADEGLKGIIQSMGPAVWYSKDPNFPYDSAFGVTAVVGASDITLNARLTTNPNWTTLIGMVREGTTYTLSATVARGTPLNVELDYDGNALYFYVNGVLQDSALVTGPIVRAPWEETSIGGFGFENAHPANPITGAIDSIRLSKAARHTGANFTPPASKYTWDSDTYALYNWDQAAPTVQPVDSNGNAKGPVLTLPMLMGQCVAGVSDGGFASPGLAGPFPHYIDLWPTGFVPNITISDLSINGLYGTTPIKGKRTPRFAVYRVNTTQSAQDAIYCADGEAFFAQYEDCVVYNCANRGFTGFGIYNRCQAVSAGIAIEVIGGCNLNDFANQPTFTSYAGIVVIGSAPYGNALVTKYTHDAEGYALTRQIGVGVLVGQAGSWQSNSCQWHGGQSDQPPFKIFGTAAASDSQVPLAGAFISTSDLWAVNTDGSFGLAAPDSIIGIDTGQGVPAVSFVIQTPEVVDFNSPIRPWCNVEGLASIIDSRGSNNLSSLSISDVKSNNVAGTFTIHHGFNWGEVVFDAPEPDANYIVNVTPQGYIGSAPAAGSGRITSIDVSPTGFFVNVEADPGGTCVRTFAWTLIRTFPPAALEVDTPVIGTGYDNPFAGETNTPFAAAMVITPNTYNTYYFPPPGLQAIVSSGDPMGAANSWEVGFESGAPWARESLSTFAVDIDAFVKNGQLCSVHNPGSHCIGMYFDGAFPYFLLDGQQTLVTGGRLTYGTQQPMVYAGERQDGTHTLTLSDVAFLKVDRQVRRVITHDQRIGPGKQPVAALFGDEWVLGAGTSIGSPGWGPQIQNARYGSKYYYMAALQRGQVAGSNGLNSLLWKPWAGASTGPALQGLCIMAGWNDILAGTSATDVMTALTETLEGGAAEATWNPPLSAITPTDQRAIAIVQTPNSPVYGGSGTSVFSIGAHSINMVWNTDWLTTTTNAVNTINADPSLSALVTATVQTSDSRRATFVLHSKTVGTAGNGLLVSVDGVSGTICYGIQAGGVLGTGLTASTFSGIDNTVNIAGETFVANFTTNVATTINNLITAIAANPTTNALVTGTAAGSTMKLTANTKGSAGNAIKVSGTAFNAATGSAWSNPLTSAATTLADGFNGAISLGVPTILLCNIPPMGTTAGFSAPKETQRVALNALIGAYAGAGVTIVDLDGTVRDPAAHQNINPTYDNGAGYPNVAGQTAIFGLINPLLP